MKKVITALMAVLTCIAMINIAYAADNGTEFGIEDDLWVGGTNGDWSDADVEIKGFSIFGSTAGITQKIPDGSYRGSVFVGGYLQVSSGSYFMGNSTFPAAGNIFILDGLDNQVLRRKAGGNGALEWVSPSALGAGDNLGNHIATTTLHMSHNDIDNANYITASSMSVSGQITVGSSITVTTNAGIGGNASVTGDLTVNGSATLGDTSANGKTITLNGANSVAGTKTVIMNTDNLTVAWIRKKS
jgi:hypothetical protein